MPVTLEYSYNKKLGLPGYSSHGVQASIRVDAESVAAALEQMPLLYKLLQAQVDADLQGVGFMPDFRKYGQASATTEKPVAKPSASDWACTTEQRKMISMFAKQQGLKRADVEALSLLEYRQAVSVLTVEQAAAFIQVLLDRRGKSAQVAQT